MATDLGPFLVTSIVDLGHPTVVPFLVLKFGRTEVPGLQWYQHPPTALEGLLLALLPSEVTSCQRANNLEVKNWIPAKSEFWEGGKRIYRIREGLKKIFMFCG